MSSRVSRGLRRVRRLADARQGPPPVPSLSGRLMLVTGAASGIGRATALAAARAGARLVVTDVNAELLDQVAEELRGSGALAHHRALDITDRDAVRAFADEVHAAHGAVDVAANVAGVATWGAVERLTAADWRRPVEINLMGPIHVIECFVPEMIRAGRGGQLVNVSSTAGLVGLPWHAPYSASKYGLRGVSEVLRFDLHRHRIGVTLVCPGGVDTPLVGTVQIAGVDPRTMAESRLSERFRRHAVSPESVAKRIRDGITANRYLVYTSRDIRALHRLQRFAPGIYALAMRAANHQVVDELERLVTPPR
jgi:NAD(P)-dependent dehydrogenase (short-subunit alcohol dehydrogenase family)